MQPEQTGVAGKNKAGLADEKNTKERERETESTILAMQGRMLVTNRKVTPRNEQVSPLCRIYNRVDETIVQITNKCPNHYR